MSDLGSEEMFLYTGGEKHNFDIKEVLVDLSLHNLNLHHTHAYQDGPQTRLLVHVGS